MFVFDLKVKLFVSGSCLISYSEDLFDFDRCTGDFSNYNQIYFPNITDTVLWYVNCFSPNNHYLYINDLRKIWQLDLTASNIIDSKKLIGGSDSNLIQHMQIGPDNKIYVGPYGSANYIGVINHPDSLGAACDFKPYQVYCHGGGWWADGGLPNTPNFALGAVAPCGVEDPNVIKDATLKIYPNPATNEIVVKNYQLVIKKLEVYNVLGQLKLSSAEIAPYQVGAESFKIDVQNLVPGVYFIRATYEKGNENFSKFIKL